MPVGNRQKFAGHSAVLFHTSRDRAFALRAAVESSGCRVSVASSLIDAVRKVWEENPDTAILGDSDCGASDLALAVQAIRIRRPNLPIFVSCPPNRAVELARAGVACELFSTDTFGCGISSRDKRVEGGEKPSREDGGC